MRAGRRCFAASSARRCLRRQESVSASRRGASYKHVTGDQGSTEKNHEGLPSFLGERGGIGSRIRSSASASKDRA